MCIRDRHWTYGPVLDTPEGLVDQIEGAFASHGDYLAAQQAGFAASFDIQARPSSERAAEAIARLLDPRLAVP